MKVGIIGSADVGQALAHGFLSEKHTVMLGTRNKMKEEVVNWQKGNPCARVGDFHETAGFGEILVLAVPGSVVEEAIRTAGPDQFRDKIVIDLTNPITSDVPVNGVLKFFTSLD